MATRPTEQIRKQFLDILEGEARLFINEMIDSRTYEHDTYNLYDSYGYGIYENGKLLRKSSRGRTANKARHWYGSEVWGYEMVDEFFESFNEVEKNGYVVVFVASIPYAAALEHRDYRVISQMNAAAWNFGEKPFKRRIVNDVKEGLFDEYYRTI